MRKKDSLAKNPPSLFIFFFLQKHVFLLKDSFLNKSLAIFKYHNNNLN